MNVYIRQSVDVTALLRANSGEINGVCIRPRAEEIELSDEAVTADLVVIASGRHTTIQKWFTGVGLEFPKTTVLDAHIGYASRLYRRNECEPRDWQALILQAASPRFVAAGLCFLWRATAGW